MSELPGIPDGNDVIAKTRDTVRVEWVGCDALYFASYVNHRLLGISKVEEAEPAVGDAGEKEMGGIWEKGERRYDFCHGVLL